LTSSLHGAYAHRRLSFSTHRHRAAAESATKTLREFLT
jgi:hypothetical protein